MKRMPALCVILTFMIAGCGEEKKQELNHSEQNSGNQVSAGQEKLTFVSGLKATSSDGIKVTIKPEIPIAGDCLEASLEGGGGDKTFVWAVNGIDAQQESSNRYCLEEDVRRDSVVSVSVKNTSSNGTASVTVGNSLPRVLDTTFELITVGDERTLEITPQIVDADEDYVELSYQWLINDQINEAYTENRLPSQTFKKGDIIQVKITPDDGYGRGRTYTSRNVNIPSAAPVVSSKPPKKFKAMEYTYQVEATDVDSSELVFTLEGAPDGMTINADTGLIVWPLDDVSPGDYRIRIIVTDPDGNTGGQEFNLNLGERKIPE